jgi:hypothetical protein
MRGGECGISAARMPNNGAGMAIGGRARVAHIYASPCSDATARCAAVQSPRRCSYSAREARRQASGDDEALVVSLTVGHTAKHAPSRRPRSPLVDRV